jgi:hypothetical protein
MQVGIRGDVMRRLAPHFDAIVKLYEAGASLEDLATRFNCSVETIRRLLISQEMLLRPAVPTPRNDKRLRDV